MKTTGYYSDIPEHEKVLARGRIADKPRSEDKTLVQLVTQYLESAPNVFWAPGWTKDVFSPSKELPLGDKTDGEWVWPADAAHYCKEYGILPDIDLVEKAVRCGGHPAALSEAEIVSIGQDFAKAALLKASSPPEGEAFHNP